MTKSLTYTSPLPKNVEDYYMITMLVEPFCTINEDGKMIRGWIYEDKPYYISEVIPRELCKIDPIPISEGDICMHGNDKYLRKNNGWEKIEND